MMELRSQLLTGSGQEAVPPIDSGFPYELNSS